MVASIMRRREDSRNPLCVAAARRRQKHNRKEDDEKKMRSIRTSSSERYYRGYALKEKKNIRNIKRKGSVLAVPNPIITLCAPPGIPRIRN